jgi:hypothetical protein
MITIAFPDRETEKRALGFLLGRFSGRVLRMSEHLVPKAALETSADQNISFTVKCESILEFLKNRILSCRRMDSAVRRREMSAYILCIAVTILLLLPGCASKNACAEQLKQRGIHERQEAVRDVKTVRVIVTYSNDDTSIKDLPYEESAASFLRWSGLTVLPASATDSDMTLKINAEARDLMGDYSSNGEPGFQGSSIQRLPGGASLSAKLTFDKGGAILYEKQFSDGRSPPKIYNGPPMREIFCQSFVPALIEVVGKPFGYSFLRYLSNGELLVTTGPRCQPDISKVRDLMAVGALTEILESKKL